MNQVVATEQKPIKLWLDDIEDGALAQARNLANLPFVFRHVAIMPDAHQGYGMPIGGVMATQGVVVPNAVGVDIGCGMCAVRTTMHPEELDVDTLKKAMGDIRKRIPVGFNHHKEMQDEEWTPELGDTVLPVVEGQYESALRQVGTLGGGNHFIEIQQGDDDRVWLMIHSGSRNLGFKVAKHYNQLAIEANERWFSAIPKAWELAFLPLDTNEGQSYLREMAYCVEFAEMSRLHMMENVKAAIYGATGGDIDFEDPIDVAHNYAVVENHFKQNVMVHRKGATRAREGEIGVIPGSQGTASYIVRGLGNPESFMSCSHGAGRKMGRKQAQRTLDLEAEIRLLDDQGIVHGIRHQRDLDEAAGAYKDIDAVMANQEDLVEIVARLTPMGVVKG